MSAKEEKERIDGEERVNILNRIVREAYNWHTRFDLFSDRTSSRHARRNKVLYIYI